MDIKKLGVYDISIGWQESPRYFFGFISFYYDGQRNVLSLFWVFYIYWWSMPKNDRDIEITI